MQRGFEIHDFTGQGMFQNQTAGMQRLAIQDFKKPGGQFPVTHVQRNNFGVATAVIGVSKQGMIYMGHVHPNLMRAAGFQLYPYQGQKLKTFQHLIAGKGRTATVNDRKFFAVAGAASNGGIDFSPIFGKGAPDQGIIVLFDGSFGELAAQIGMHPVVLGRDQQTRCILVQAVYYTGTTLIPAEPPDAGIKIQKSVYQGARRVSRTRMNHKAGRLVQYNE